MGKMDGAIMSASSSHGQTYTVLDIPGQMCSANPHTEMLPFILLPPLYPLLSVLGPGGVGFFLRNPEFSEKYKFCRKVQEFRRFWGKN